MPGGQGVRVFAPDAAEPSVLPALTNPCEWDMAQNERIQKQPSQQLTSRRSQNRSLTDEPDRHADVISVPDQTRWLLPTILLHIARILAPSLLLTASVGKLQTWDAYVTSMEKTLPVLGLRFAQDALILLLPVAEALLALFVILTMGRFFRLSTWLGFLLAATFLAVRVRLSILGVRLECPCFGNLPPVAQADATGLAAAMILLTLFATLTYCGDPLPDARRLSPKKSTACIISQEN